MADHNTDSSPPAKLAQVDTTLAGWSWGPDPDARRDSNSTMAPTPVNTQAFNSQRKSEHESSVSNSPVSSPTVELPTRSDSLWSRSRSPSPPVDEALAVRRRMSAPSSMLGAAASPTRPALSPGVDRRTRRELLGSRKPSNYPAEELHFKDHRDSVQLYHERLIRRDDEEQVERVASSQSGPSRSRAAVEPKIDSLRHSTWSRPKIRDNFSASAGPQSKPINSIAKQVRSPDKDEGGDQQLQTQGESWLALSAPVVQQHQQQPGQQPPTPSHESSSSSSDSRRSLSGSSTATATPLHRKATDRFLVLTSRP